MAEKSSLFSTESFLLLRDISYYFLFVPVLSSLIRWNFLVKSQKRIAIIAIISLLVEVLTRVLSKQGLNSVPVFHGYMPVLFLLIMGVYSSAKIRIVRKEGLRLILILFYSLTLMNTLWLQPVNSFNTNVIALASFVFVVVSIVYFHRLIQTSTNEFFLQDPILWFNVGNLLYYASIFILFVVVQRILSSPLDAQNGAWILNAFFYITLNICYSIALWIKPKN